MFGTSTNGPAKWGLKDILIWLTILPILLSMWMIFGFSAQSAEQSSQTSHQIVDVVIRMFVPDYGQLDAARQADVAHQITVIVRKTAHALEYAMLGFFLQLHVTLWRSRRQSRAPETTTWFTRVPPWAWSLLVGCLYAVTDEIHQGFVAGRGSRITDVGVDTVGVIAGIAVCELVWRMIRRWRRHRGTV